MGESRKGFRIPRKGRIRIVLVLIAFAIGLRIFYNKTVGSRAASNNATKATGDTTAIADGTKRPAPSPAEVKQLAKRIAKKAPFTREDIATLLRQSPPHLSETNQIFTAGKKRIEVHYSIDTTLQNSASRLFRRYHPKYGALAAIDPGTGRVLALVSYCNPDEKPLSGSLYSKAIFPAASVFKIITAAGAIEQGGFSPSTQLKTLGRNHTLYLSQLEKDPSNFRTVTLQEAFAYSINPVFGRLGIFTLGKSGLQEFSEKFGFNSKIPFELVSDIPRAEVGDSAFALAELASGFNQKTLISPFFGALLAGSISHGGKMLRPSLVDSITSLADTSNIYRLEPTLWRMPCSKATADQLMGLMNAVARYGTARKSFSYVKKSNRFANITYGGKTGNVDKDGLGRVDWFVGFAKHASDPQQHIAVGVVTVHGPLWTVHSSFLGAEVMRKHIRTIQIAQKEALAQRKLEATRAATSKDSSVTVAPKVTNKDKES